MNTLKLIYLYWRVAILNELQYRINFFLQLFQSLIALLVGWVGLALIFRQTSDLAGWTSPELLVVLGVYTLMGGVVRAFVFPSMFRLLQDITEGNLDFALTKPADSQLLVSIREVQIWQLIDVVLGLVVIFYAENQLPVRASLFAGLVFALSLAMGILLMYCFCICITTIAFWATRADNIIELFQGVYQAGRVPVGIYPQWLRILLTFLVPVAIAITIPAEAITQRLTTTNLLVAGGFTLFVVIFTRWLWLTGIKSYAGASA
jgi:ABC-2 type transport system permease protein